jgi:hypothetical protein
MVTMVNHGVHNLRTQSSNEFRVLANWHGARLERHVTCYTEENNNSPPTGFRLGVASCTHARASDFSKSASQAGQLLFPRKRIRRIPVLEKLRCQRLAYPFTLQDGTHDDKPEEPCEGLSFSAAGSSQVLSCVVPHLKVLWACHP